MPSSKIKAVRAREILDSRGLPTVEAEVDLEGGATGRAAVPSGASTGVHEAVELRDGDASRFHGKGVLKAVGAARGEAARALKGKDAADQAGLDEALIALDGTPGKGRLGANAILAVSMAASRAAAAAGGLPLYEHIRRAFPVKHSDWLLPVPMLNIVNGGKHADSGLDVQEFMIVPTGAEDFAEAIRLGCEVYQTLKTLLAAMKESTAVGDEGGFAPRLGRHERALEVILEAVRESGCESEVRLAMDSAASEFHKDGKYVFEGKPLSGARLGERYADWAKRFPLVSLEDPFAEDDWDAWKAFTRAHGAKIRVIGDDLFVTNIGRLERGIREGAANAILIKLNQIGTVTETVRAVLRAQEAGFSAVISHRSGETEDPYIADLAVALNAGAIKTGAPCRSERLSKYNQLLRIEEGLGEKARYAGGAAFAAARPAAAART